jgi:hypothetical protein
VAVLGRSGTGKSVLLRIDDTRIKTMGLGGDQTEAGTNGRAEIVIYPGGADNSAVEVKSK